MNAATILKFKGSGVVTSTANRSLGNSLDSGQETDVRLQHR
jgi:hypothetical protein